MFEEVVEGLVDMADQELREHIDAIELARRRLDAQMSAALAAADARNLHGADGHRTMAAFCRSRLNWSTTEATRRLSLARAVDRVPGLGEAWHQGHIGFPQAMKFATINANSRVAPALAEFAPTLLDHAERRAEHGDHADGYALARTDAQRRFDALVAIFRAAATATQPGTAAEPLVNVVIDANTWGRMLHTNGLSTTNAIDGTPIDPFTGLPITDSNDLLAELTNHDDPALSHRCETSDGVRLHPHDVLRAALAGHIRRVVVDSASVVINMGRQQRLFTGNARAAAKLLISRCEHSGCELPADWCDVDHVDEWDRDAGSTDQHNAAVLCRHHNNDKHHKRWRTKRATNGSTYTIDADGNLLLPVGARPPTFTHSQP